MDKTGEVLVAESLTHEEAIAARSHIMREFAKMWVIVMKQQDAELYNVFVANEWCGKAEQETIASIAKMIDGLFGDHVHEVSDDEIVIVDEQETTQRVSM